MEEKKFDIIKAGSTVVVKGLEDLGVGTVLMQNERSGKCLVKFAREDKRLNDAAHTLIGNCGIWAEPEHIVIRMKKEEEPAPEFMPDIRKNWAVMLQCIDGTVSFAWRCESGRSAYGWIEGENLTPAEAAREWAEKQERDAYYKKLCWETVSEKKEHAAALENKPGERYVEKLGELIGVLETLKKLAEE